MDKFERMRRQGLWWFYSMCVALGLTGVLILFNTVVFVACIPLFVFFAAWLVNVYIYTFKAIKWNPKTDDWLV